MASLRSSQIEADYDSFADVLHISLVDSDHPAYAENVDDMIFVMRSTDSDLLLGFEILDAKRHGAETIRKALLPLIQAEKRRLGDTMSQLHSKLEELERTHLEDLVPA